MFEYELKMDFSKYGYRLPGYSVKNGKKLYRTTHNGDYAVGYIESTEKETHGPITITIWTLENGDKYHYVN